MIPFELRLFTVRWSLLLRFHFGDYEESLLSWSSHEVVKTALRTFEYHFGIRVANVQLFGGLLDLLLLVEDSGQKLPLGVGVHPGVLPFFRTR